VIGIPNIEVQWNGQDIVIMQGLIVFDYFESLYGEAAYRLATRTWETALWDKIIKDHAKTPLKMRWGLTAVSGIEWSPWKEVLANMGDFTFYREVIDVDLQGTGAGFPLKETVNTRVFRDMKVSDMVSQIAGEHDLDADVEETKGEMTLYQCTESDAAFLRNQCACQAVSASGGRTDYYIYVKDGKTLVFKPLLWEPSGLKFTFALYGDTGDDAARIDEIKVKYRRALMGIQEKALRTEFRGYDPLNKEMISFTADDGSVPFQKLAPQSLDPPEKPSDIEITPEPEPPEHLRREMVDSAKATWGSNIHGLFRTNLQMTLLAESPIGKLVNLEVRDAENKQRFMSGNWLVYAVRNQIIPGKRPTTTLFLERRTHRG
jgi:hypothetical protein